MPISAGVRSFGAPGMGDQSYASRVEAWAESTEPLEPAQVAAVLTREAALRPDEPGILMETTWDDKGEVNRESFLVEVKDGKQSVVTTLPKL